MAVTSTPTVMTSQWSDSRPVTRWSVLRPVTIWNVSIFASGQTPVRK